MEKYGIVDTLVKDWEKKKNRIKYTSDYIKYENIYIFIYLFFILISSIHYEINQKKNVEIEVLFLKVEYKGLLINTCMEYSGNIMKCVFHLKLIYIGNGIVSIHKIFVNQFCICLQFWYFVQF